MKYFFCILTNLLIIFGCKAQTQEDTAWNTRLDNGQKIMVWSRAEKSPEFIGGIHKWKAFLDSNLNKEKVIASYKRERKSRKITALISFIVMKDGSIEKIYTQSKDTYTNEPITKEFADEVIKVIKLSPRWIPPYQNNRIVNCWQQEIIQVIIPAK